jgi:putative tryptophan/tyrosine transport system substrate-binding protein
MMYFNSLEGRKRMRRRDFITLLGGAAVSWPIRTRAQQGDQTRRIGVLSALAESDPEARAEEAAFRKRLDELGWIDGQNTRVDARWAAGSVQTVQQFAKELIRLNPDVLVAITTPATAALRAETKTIPIVFASVTDPVGQGFVTSLAKPGGNTTGFTFIEASLGSKWLELLREIAPSVARVAILFNPQTAPYARAYVDTFRSAATAINVAPVEAPVHNTADVQAIMAELGREGGTGVIVVPDTSTRVYGQTIIELANRYRMPAIYYYRRFVTDGGLLSYGVDVSDQLRGAATYVDHILRGAKPAQLPVQEPTKFELVINLKTAKALGLDVPVHLQQLADEVIE